VDASYLGNGCRGWASAAPDFEVTYTGGSSSLRFYFIADNPTDDTTLIVSDPSGTWMCGDDSYGTPHPTVDFVGTAPDGVYDVWIGSYTQGETISGTFYITELDANHP
jgi:serine protease Do